MSLFEALDTILLEYWTAKYHPFDYGELFELMRPLALAHSNIATLINRKLGRLPHARQSMEFLYWLYCEGAGSRRFAIIMKYLRGNEGMVITGSSLMRFMHPSPYPTWEPGDVDIFELDNDSAAFDGVKFRKKFSCREWEEGPESDYDELDTNDTLIKFLNSYKLDPEEYSDKTVFHRGKYVINFVHYVLSDSDDEDTKKTTIPFQLLRKHCEATFNPRQAAWMFDGFMFHPPLLATERFVLDMDLHPSFLEYEFKEIYSLSDFKAAIATYIRRGRSIEEWAAKTHEILKMAEKAPKQYFLLHTAMKQSYYSINELHVTRWDGHESDNTDLFMDEDMVWPSIPIKNGPKKNGVSGKGISMFLMQVQAWARDPLSKEAALCRYFRRLKLYLRRGYTIRIMSTSIVLTDI